MATVNVNAELPDYEGAAAQVKQTIRTTADRVAIKLGDDSTGDRVPDPLTEQPPPDIGSDDASAVQEQALKLPGLETY